MPHNINHYGQTLEQLAEMGVGILPQNLQLALKAFEEDTLFYDQMGSVIDEFIKIKIKNMEWIEYMKQVLDWELERYVEYF